MVQETDLTSALHGLRQEIEQALEKALPAGTDCPEELHKAMRYSVFNGGKRLRPLLVLASCEALGGERELAIDPGVAFELVHTYSLIHDDLPLMDNDDLRRGKPTCHKVFGEAMALLAGDALLTLAFEVVAGSRLAPMQVKEICAILSRCAGSKGMVGGQVLDLQGEGKDPDLESTKEIHARKTGAMISGCLEAGAVAAGATGRQRENMARAGLYFGLAFQIKDDILDVTSTAEDLGKTPGKDLQAGKMTWPKCVGIEESMAQASKYVGEGKAILADIGIEQGLLPSIATFILDRAN